jgi:L-ribulose-5-phosphate 3-epimerase
MKFGSLQGILGEPLDSVFDVAKTLGFDGVELDWHSLDDATTGQFAKSQRAELRRRAQNAGVEIPSVAAHFLNSGGIAANDETTRRSGLRAVQTGIELCRDLSARVLLVPFFGPAEIVDEDGKKHLVESARKLAPIAQSANVKLGIEGALRGDEMAQLLSEIGSPFIGSYWDMANCMSIGFDPLEEVQQLQSHIVQVHAKEFKGEARTRAYEYPNLNTVPFGSGDVPICAVLKKLRSVGYDGYIVLETGSFDDAKASARDALRVLTSAQSEME